MKVGDLAWDNSLNRVVLIIDKGIAWRDSDDQIHIWDFEVMCSSSKTYYADIDELGEMV